jgi:hypothetical protein
VHGTFTHPSPVAALVYRGDAGPGASDTLAERLDGRALFGRPLEALDADTLDLAADRLGVGAVVVLDEDIALVRRLADNPAFARIAAAGPFLIYARRAPPSIPARLAPGRWRLDATGEPGGWVSARTAYYPLWRAERGGAALAVRRGPWHTLEVRLDGAPGPIDLVYEAGTWETSGVAVTLAAAAVWIGAVLWTRRAGRPVG